MAGKCKAITCVGILLVLGVVLLAVSFCVRPFFKKKVTNALLLDSKDRQEFDKFLNPVGVTVSATFFNITNLDEILTGAAPNVTEVGEFTYSVNFERFDLNWSHDKKTLQFREWMHYTYKPELSNPAYPDDTQVKISTLNVPYYAIVYGAKAQGLDFIVPAIFNSSFTDKEMLFTELTPPEILFGYNNTHVTDLYNQLKAMGMEATIPPSLPGVVGANYSREYVVNGPSNFNVIGTGVGGTKQYLSERFSMKDVTSCNGAVVPQEPPCPQNPLKPGSTTVMIGYEYPKSSEVKGSLGSQFPTHLEADTTLFLWVDQLWRTIPLKKVGEVTSRDIKLWRFSVEDYVWKNASKEPANAEYFQFFDDGFLNITNIQHGVPIFVSRNHFYKCNKSYYEAIKGMKKPNPDTDGFHLDVEPNTGLAMGGKASLQLNMPVGPIAYSTEKHFQKVTPVLLPVVAVSAGGQLTESLAKQFQDQIGWALGPVQWLPWVAGIIGVLLLASGIGVCCYFIKQKEPVDPLIRNQGPHNM